MADRKILCKRRIIQPDSVCIHGRIRYHVENLGKRHKSIGSAHRLVLILTQETEQGVARQNLVGELLSGLGVCLLVVCEIVSVLVCPCRCSPP